MQVHLSGDATIHVLTEEAEPLPADAHDAVLACIEDAPSSTCAEVLAEEFNLALSSSLNDSDSAQFCFSWLEGSAAISSACDRSESNLVNLQSIAAALEVQLGTLALTLPEWSSEIEVLSPSICK